MRYCLIILFLIHFFFPLRSQNEKIKIKKDNFLFFQSEKKSDTISYNKHDLFYIKLSENNRCNVRIEVQNGQFQKTNSDTLIRLIPVKNINYIHTFLDSVYVVEIKKSHFTKQERKIKPCCNLKAAINGANNLNNPSIIIVSFFKTGTDSLILKNSFLYR